MFTEPKRRLIAIVSADVAGYSRLMGADEEGTLVMLNAAREIFREHIEAIGGRIVDTAGDSVLSVFDSVVDAVETMQRVQDGLVTLNAERNPEQIMLFRVGINLGDVIEQSDGTIYGDGVNIAARIQSLAEPGGIAISGSAHDFIGDRAGVNWRSLGDQEVKNIARPVRVYLLGGDDSTLPEASRPDTPLIETRLPSRPSIAVLPFVNMSGREDDEYFADGISEDIITELSRFRELIVTARNSAFSYKGRAVKAQDVGEELNVRYIVEGSVRKAGDRVSISAQLIKAATGHQLWAERFDRKLEDVFEVQDEVSRKIVATLIGRLNDSERQRARHNSGNEMSAAYDMVLRGREHFLKFNREDNLAARGLYLQAIKFDSNYARAYSSLAWTYSIAYNEHWADDPRDALDRAFEYAQRSVYMQPEAHSFRLCLGMVYFFQKDLEKAIDCFQSAVELNVNDADCYTFLSQALSLNGEHEKAIELLDHAFAINPHLGEWPMSLYIVAYFNAREYDNALAIIEKLHSPQPSNYRWMAATYAALGRVAEAHSCVARYFEAYPDFDLPDHLSRMAYRDSADLEHYAAALRTAGFEWALETAN